MPNGYLLDSFYVILNDTISKRYHFILLQHPWSRIF